MNDLEDHGLPFVQLKEQRRELVVALAGRNDPISNFEIAEIASLQQAIAAMEAVVDDLDSRNRILPSAATNRFIFQHGEWTRREEHEFGVWAPHDFAFADVPATVATGPAQIHEAGAKLFA